MTKKEKLNEKIKRLGAQYGAPKKYDGWAYLEWMPSLKEWVLSAPIPKEATIYIGCERGWGKFFKIYWKEEL